MYTTKESEMDLLRQNELNFLMRTDSAIPVTDSRSNELFKNNYYDDFYTVRELVEQGYMEYVGRQEEYVCLRPLNSFKMYINLEIRDLVGGELITMSLTRDGRSEFEDWLATQ